MSSAPGQHVNNTENDVMLFYNGSLQSFLNVCVFRYLSKVTVVSPPDVFWPRH